jgi:hypothetical protein
MSRRSRSAGLIFVYCLWLLVPLAVWADGYSDGAGLDGPCLGNGEWSMKHAFEGYGGSAHSQLWPPASVRCEVNTPSGTFERVFPGTATYVGASALVLLPFAAWPLATRLGRMAHINRAPGE